MPISAGAYACIERNKRILQDTISSTDRGAMIAWLEKHCRIPVPNWMSDEDIQGAFYHLSDQRGGFVKIEFVTVTAAERT